MIETPRTGFVRCGAIRAKGMKKKKAWNRGLNLPSIDVLREHLRYDPDTGELWWKIARGSRDLSVPIGSEAKTRYVQFGFDYTILLGHRAAFAIHEGHWPNEVDHINGDTRDNRRCNLREVTRAQNILNRKCLHPKNTSGSTGVYYNKRAERWMAKIKVGSKEICRFFKFKEEAIRTRRELVKMYHGEAFYACL